MDIALDPGDGLGITHYEPGELVLTNGERFTDSIILTPTSASPWPVGDYSDLTPETFMVFIRQKPELVILGTGTIQHFPSSDILLLFGENKIGLEIMTTDAACRTYNILMAEDRVVMAGLLNNGDKSCIPPKT